MRWPWFLAATGLLTGAVGGCGAGPISEGAAYGQLRPHLLETTLSNGLRIYMVEDHSSPLVSYQSWVHVGSVNEREAGEGDDHGGTGLSHFFEHMMFRGTERFPNYFDEVYAVGGRLNAFTWHDETVFWENVPSQHLEHVITMEADRMEHMTVDFLSLEPGREAVKSERLLRTEGNSEGKAWEVLQSRVFEQFPYHWGTIGWMKDLNAIEVAEAAAYHKTYYVPNNTTIFVVGDHDPVETLRWIRSAYQHLPEKALPPERFAPEPEQTEERRDVVFRSSNPQFVIWAWPTPSPRERDFLVLEVLDRILAGGRAARLQKALVYSRPPQLSRLYAYLLPMRFPYMYVWSAVLEPGMTAEHLEEIVDSELAMLVADGVTNREIGRAIAALRSDVVRRNLSNHDKAEAMGFSLRATDNPLAWVERLEQYETVDSDEIQRVARTLLTPRRRTSVPVVAPSRLPALASVWASSPPAMSARLAAALRSSAEVVISRQALESQERIAEEELLAIELLEGRAADEMKDAPESRAKEIEAYVSTNERGAVVRRKGLEADREEIEATRAALVSRLRALRQEWRSLQRKDWYREPGQEHTLLAMHIIEASLEPTAPPPPPVLSLDDWTRDPKLAPHVFAHGAMLAWLLDAHGLARTGQETRARVLELSETLARSPGGLVAAARTLAWDTQISGRRLTNRATRRRP